MKRIFVLLSIVAFGFISFAQDCETFIPWQVGKKITTENYDEKDKLTGSSTSEVISINQLVDKTEAVVESESFDKKGASQGKIQLKYYCNGDSFEVDMKSMLNQEQMAGFENMTIEYNMQNMSYPKVMLAGMSLSDGFVEAIISNEGMKIMTIRTDITNIKIEAIESITVPAGTYTAYKISSDLTSKTGFMTMNMKSISWMVTGIGAVRTETYDKKGKIMGYSVISKIE
ncbi:MAG TPA: hypothetical protein PKN32_03695 [Bacteroidales bacterium]|nr:hypothetical protein [Bacteroidales bacterium]